MTEPCVGASVCASGSHVWKGNIGTFTAKPMNMPAKIQIAVFLAIPPPFWRNHWNLNEASSGVALLFFVMTNKAMNDTSINAEPNIVYRKNFSDAYCRLSPPHTPIMKYIG